MLRTTFAVLGFGVLPLSTRTTLTPILRWFPPSTLIPSLPLPLTYSLAHASPPHLTAARCLRLACSAFLRLLQLTGRLRMLWYGAMRPLNFLRMGRPFPRAA